MSVLLRQFIREIFVEAKMSGPEIKKYSGVPGKDRWEIFLNRINAGDVFIYEPRVRTPKKGSLAAPQKKVQRAISISPKNNGALIAALTSKSVVDYVAAFSAGVEAFDVNTGAQIILRSPYDLVKDTDFGSTDPLLAEKIQVADLQAHLDSLKGEDRLIKVFVGQKGVVPVDGINHIMGTNKEDIELLFKGQVVAYVSLKSANRPAQMMQWDGISELFNVTSGSTPTAQNTEIQDFVMDVDSYVKAYGVEYLYRDVSDDIARQAVYGPGLYVDLVAASRNTSFVLEPEHGPGVYIFSGNVFYNPTLPDKNWKPVLFAMPNSTRNNLGVSGMRMGVYPVGFVNSKRGIYLP